MTRLPTIFAAAVVTYALRLAGFTPLRPGQTIWLDGFLRYVPVAVFAALLAPGIGGRADEQVPRLAGAAAAVLLMLRVRQLWATIAVGMAAFWLVRGLL
jgi:branched-subunit amino acid transport protein